MAGSCPCRAGPGVWGFSPTLGFIFYLVIPCVVVGFVLDKLESFLFGVLWLGGAVVLLLYSFGRENFNVLADRYHSYCVSGDHEAAYLFAQSELSVVPEDLSGDSPWQAHQAIQSRLLYLGYQRWFAVLFFFVLLGPIGALLYRLLQLSERLQSRHKHFEFCTMQTGYLPGCWLRGFP